MAGALKFDHQAILIGLGATSEVAKIVVDRSIPNAIVAGLGLESAVSMNGQASGFTGARPATERQV